MLVGFPTYAGFKAFDSGFWVTGLWAKAIGRSELCQDSFSQMTNKTNYYIKHLVLHNTPAGDVA